MSADVHGCACCNKHVGRKERRNVEFSYGGRMNGYCQECALARCDAYPGECPRWVAD